MKNIVWTAPVAVLLLLYTVEAGSQNSSAGTDQSKLMQAWTGTWLQKWGKSKRLQIIKRNVSFERGRTEKN